MVLQECVCISAIVVGGCSMLVVVGAVLALAALPLYYFRYIRGTPLRAPSIIEVGKSIKALRYSRSGCCSMPATPHKHTHIHLPPVLTQQPAC